MDTGWLQQAFSPTGIIKFSGIEGQSRASPGVNCMINSVLQHWPWFTQYFNTGPDTSISFPDSSSEVVSYVNTYEVVQWLQSSSPFCSQQMNTLLFCVVDVFMNLVKLHLWKALILPIWRNSAQPFLFFFSGVLHSWEESRAQSIKQTVRSNTSMSLPPPPAQPSHLETCYQTKHCVWIAVHVCGTLMSPMSLPPIQSESPLTVKSFLLL